MTWPEVKVALEAGKTTALIYTGGTEQRGPQNVNGGHNLMARETVRAIAVRLGNAIALPVLPYTPNNASAAAPGHDRPDQRAARRDPRAPQRAGDRDRLQERGPHGRPRRGPAERLSRHGERSSRTKYAPQGVHVVYCDDVYTKRQADFDAYLKSQNLPTGGHASIPDTSEMLYLGGDKGWVRKELIKTALGDPVGGRGGRGRGEPADPNAPATPPRVNNGISGDARASTVELGKREFDMKIDYAVKQIQALLAAAKPQG